MSNIISKAADFAQRKHAGQVRKYTGEPYVGHPVQVANLVQQYGGTDKMIAAALLHDTLEDTVTTSTELRIAFGEDITRMVIELTDAFTPERFPHLNRAKRKALERNRLATVSGPAQTIKVADLIDNTGSIVALDPKFAKTYLQEKSALLDVLTKADPGLLAKARQQMETTNV